MSCGVALERPQDQGAEHYARDTGMPHQHGEVNEAELFRISEGDECCLCSNQEDGTNEEGATC